MPSLYEGFGLPVVEAMACGTPVITTRTASLPEIVGNLEIAIWPLTESALAEAIRCVLEEPHSQRLRVASIERAQVFRREVQTATLMKAYCSITESRIHG